jgi:hypothetical protein
MYDFLSLTCLKDPAHSKPLHVGYVCTQNFDRRREPNPRHDEKGGRSQTRLAEEAAE